MTYLTISSPSGLPKNPPTSAPTKDIPATEKERHIGTVDLKNKVIMLTS